MPHREKNVLLSCSSAISVENSIITKNYVDGVKVDTINPQKGGQDEGLVTLHVTYDWPIEMNASNRCKVQCNVKRHFPTAG